MNVFKYRNLKAKNYFEGWYLRVTDEKEGINLAFIFAITKYEEDPHAFIQVYDGVLLKNTYYRFNISDFKYEDGKVYIKDNYLSINEMFLDINDIKVNISMDKTKLNGKTNSSAMSYMANFPLECFQEVNIIDGIFKGELSIKNEIRKITGKTYMEKTYGKKFPQSWIWIQSNHFDKDVALTFAYGKIPLLNFRVKGFFSVLNIAGTVYRFGSYNLARLKINKKSDSKVEVTLKRGFHKLIIEAEMVDSVKLVGPMEKGKMELDVFESINSKVSIKLYKRKMLIFESKGKNVGFELMI